MLIDSQWMLVLVGIITFGVVAWQAIETGRSAEAARASVETQRRGLKLSYAPMITIHSPEVSESFNWAGISKISVKWQITNIGATVVRFRVLGGHIKVNSGEWEPHALPSGMLALGPQQSTHNYMWATTTSISELARRENRLVALSQIVLEIVEPVDGNLFRRTFRRHLVGGTKGAFSGRTVISEADRWPAIDGEEADEG